ncbi:DNA primase small subunit [Anthophora retusa]
MKRDKFTFRISDTYSTVFTGRILQINSALAEYLQIIDGGEYMKKKVNLPGEKIHHSIKRALEAIEAVFIPYFVEEQNILGTDEGIEKFLQLLSEEEDRQELKAQFNQSNSSKDRWNTFVKYINVSKGLNHLLKSPFCVHPKTGKVCIPFTANTVDKFHPDKVPTITTLIEEINEFDLKDKAAQETHDSNARRIKDYKKTSLNKSLHIFQEFLWNLENERKGQKIKESDEKMEF